MSSNKLKYQIKKTLQEMNQIVNEMILVSNMVGGSFGITYRKCGKANCWCSNEKQNAHPFIRITFVENRKSRTKAIPKKDQEWIKEMTNNYKNFRQHFQILRQSQNKLNELLNQFEKDVKTKTSRLKDYL